MKLLIVRDKYRMREGTKTFRQCEEEGIYTTVCSSNIFAQLPEMEFDLVVLDLVEKTLEESDFAFLQGLKSQKYKAVVAIADQCSKSEGVKEIFREKGVTHYVERPLAKEVFFEEVDKALAEYKVMAH